MRQLNNKINVFVFLQILCGIAWVIASNYLWSVLDPVFTTVFTATDSFFYTIGLRGFFLAFAQFAVFAITVLGTFIGTVMWVMSGKYRRGIGMIALVMGIGLLFGSFASHMKPLSEFDTMGFAMIARAVLAIVVYFGIAAATASQVLEWIAADELRDPSVKIRYSHSIPLCTILPVTHLFIGYAPTMFEQFITLAYGSVILIAFTIWTNRSRRNSWKALGRDRRDLTPTIVGSDFPRIGYDSTTQRF
jgi:hypothetical protein